MTLSVLMSVYKNDTPKWFQECLESLVGQTLYHRNSLIQKLYR